MDLSIAVAQLNPTVGDLNHNTKLILDAWQDYKDHDLIVFSELIVTGYPPEDLILKPSFTSQTRKAIEELADQAKDLEAAALISAPWLIEGALYNAALLLHKGEIIAVRAKHNLPTYGVFDEDRLFETGPLPATIPFKDTKLGVMICEDMWQADVSKYLKNQGADILIALNASPFEADKLNVRYDIAKQRVLDTDLPLLYVNQVGGQDELVFDGASFMMDAAGSITHQYPAFESNVFCLGEDKTISSASDSLGTLYNALKLGLRDYVTKNGFPGVLIGLSGGIDSALTAVIAADALGPNKVQCYMLPTEYTSQISLDDAEALAKNLQVSLDTVPIEGVQAAFHQILPENGASVMFENIQSRIRGATLMALSNDNGAMLVTTGNKSEMAVGYSTLYGDMCGGFNPLKDLYKTEVYELSKWINRDKDIIPERIITRPPSAELKPDQTDQDSLPSYDVLDSILKHLIEDDLSPSDIAAKGLDIDTVTHINKLLHRAEYKRRQAPPGVKITSRAFGRDRRYPITHRFYDD